MDNDSELSYPADASALKVPVASAAPAVAPRLNPESDVALV